MTLVTDCLGFRLYGRYSQPNAQIRNTIIAQRAQG